MNKDSQVHFGSVRVSFSGDIKTLNRICKKFNGRDGVGIEIKSFLETVYFEGNPFQIGGDYGEASIELASVSDQALTEILKIMANDKDTEK